MVQKVDVVEEGVENYQHYHLKNFQYLELVAVLFCLENLNKAEMEEAAKKHCQHYYCFIIAVVPTIKKFSAIKKFIKSRPKLQISNVRCLV